MKKLSFLFAALVAGVLAPVAEASTSDGIGNLYWIGDVDTKYATPGNWRFNSATGATLTVAPKNSDYQANIYLTDAASEDHRTVTAAYQCNSIVVQSGTGWNYQLNGTHVVKTFTVKSGAEFSLTSGTMKNTGITVEEGGVATLSGLTWDSSKTISGAGTLILASGPNGYSNARTATIGATLVRIKADKLFSGTVGNSFILNSVSARVQYKGTLANAQKLIGVSGDGKGGIVASSKIPEGYELAVRQLDGDLSGYVEFYFRQTSQPVISAASLSRTDDGAFEVTARLSQGADGTTIKAIADDGAGNTFETTYSGTVEVDADMSFELDGLASDRTYVAKVVAENDTAVDEKAIDAVFYNGQLSLALVADAFERDTVAGTVSVSRVSADVYPLTVNYAFTGVTAVEGVDYVAPSGVITIPAGETSAMIPVQPIMNVARTEDVTLSVSLQAGLYDASADPITVTIHDFTIPTDACVWMGDSGVDNNASTAANWYQSKLPTKDDKILLAAFSPSNIVWDAGVNGLPDTVASWEQTVDYPGTVTFKTVYPVDGVEDAFTNFTVTGNCLVNGGKWTHLANNADETYVLNVTVGGSLTLGENGAISVMGKGYAPGKFPQGSAIGAHAAAYTGNPANLYGDVYAPMRCGSGGISTAASCGGGAIKLTVGGAAVIDGTLDAQSSTQASAKSLNPEKGVGAGGSIWVTAASISGSGTVVASAYEGNGTSYSTEAGSGGRVALVATAGEVTIPFSKIRVSGSRGANAVGGGTVFVKNASDAYGTLYLNEAMTYSVFDYVQHWPTKNTVTMIPADETWTFDRVVFNGKGILAIPEGTTLALPNGFASVAALSPANRPECGILYRGGTIDVPAAAAHQLKDGWLFQAETPYVFPSGDVALSNKAGFGCFKLMAGSIASQPSCTLTVNGNLSIAEGCGLVGEGRGYRSTGLPSTKGAHGGVAAGYLGEAFDSILNPLLCGASCGTGNGGVNNNMSGAAITLTVKDTFTMNGTASVKAEATNWGAPRAGAGSLNITAARLEGSGSFSADGQKTDNKDGLSGAGGRIAIRLTDKEATFDNFPVNKITADSAIFSAGLGASAGTIYLQSGSEAEGAGTIVVKSAVEVPVPTPIPSLAQGGESDNLKNANLDIESYGRVQLAASVSMSALTMSAPAKLDLNGKTLTVNTAKLGGTKLKPGTYAASDCPEFLTGGGSLVVKGTGLMLLVR